MNENDKRQRINFLRGLAIFFMLWGHSIQYCCANQFDFFDNALFKFIYSFHMPLFMLISGYLFFFSEQKREMIELIEYKSKSLLYPILMFSIVNHVITKGVYSIHNGNLKSLLETPSLTSLWFLWSVLACSVVLSFAVKASHRTLLQVVLAIIGIGVVAVFPCSTMNVYMYPYFVFGYYFAKNEKRLSKYRNVIGAISLLVFTLLLIFFEKKHLIYTTGLFSGSIRTSLIIDIYRWVIGLIGSTAVFFIGSIVFNIFPNNKITSGVVKLGNDSLAVYVLSVIFLSYGLPVIAGKLLSILSWVNWNDYIWLYNLIVTPLVAAIYSILLLMLIKLFKRIGIYRLLFGR